MEFTPVRLEDTQDRRQEEVYVEVPSGGDWRAPGQLQRGLVKVLQLEMVRVLTPCTTTPSVASRTEKC